MSEIHAVAVTVSGVVTTKTALRTLVKADPSAVKILPGAPSPALAYGVTADRLPFGRPVTIHLATKAPAEIERKANGQIVVR